MYDLTLLKNPPTQQQKPPPSPLQQPPLPNNVSHQNLSPVGGYNLSSSPGGVGYSPHSQQLSPLPPPSPQQYPKQNVAYQNYPHSAPAGSQQQYYSSSPSTTYNGNLSTNKPASNPASHSDKSKKPHGIFFRKPGYP